MKEYLTITSSGTVLDGRLNELAKDKWELIGFVYNSYRDLYVYIFSRKLK